MHVDQAPEATDRSVLRCGRLRGFTLIELLSVLAIIALLLTIVTPRYMRSVTRAEEAALRETLRVTREAIDKFHADTGRYPEAIDELVERRYLRSLPGDPLTRSTQTWVFVSPPAGIPGVVFDLRSGAPGQSLDGAPYADL